MQTEKFCVQWNEFEKDISSAFRHIREDRDFFDITIACEDDQIEAHKVILSVCSPFFKNVLLRNKHQHPLIYLKGVSYRDMEAVLNFMYHGEVNIAQDDLNSFLQVAEDLSVRGLTQHNYPDSVRCPAKPHPPPSELSLEKTIDHTPPLPLDPSILDNKLEPEVEVKCEPDEVSQPHQQESRSMDMFEDVSQMMSMDTGEYGGNYGDQEYDNSTQTGQVLQDPNKIQCDICFKVIHKHTLNRHKKYQHGTSTPVQCNLCEKIFKNEGTLKGHLRQSHNIYQTNPQDGVGKPVKVSAASN